MSGVAEFAMDLVAFCIVLGLYEFVLAVAAFKMAAVNASSCDLLSAEGNPSTLGFHVYENDSTYDDDDGWPYHAVDDVHLGMSLADDDVVQFLCVVVTWEWRLSLGRPLLLEFTHLLLVLVEISLAHIERALRKRTHRWESDLTGSDKWWLMSLLTCHLV